LNDQNFVRAAVASQFATGSTMLVSMRGRIIRLVLAAVSLYFVWPALVKVFGSYDELSKIRPGWFVVMAAFEAASFGCVWLLIAISTSSRHWTLIATSQLVGNAVSSIVPGGGAAGGPLQYSYMVRGGEDPERVVSGLATTTLLSLTTLFGLAALCVPVMLWLGNIDRRLQRAAWLGSGVFVIMMVLGTLAFTRDGLLRVAARFVQWVLNAVGRVLHRDRSPRDDLPNRVIEQRDRIRGVLGAKWPWALLAVVSKWAFDYFALVAAVGATGVHVQTVPVLLAYVAASVLAMIPVTPGGLGFVEAGLAVTLVWAGVPGGNATVATLAYRLVSYWLPLVAGVAAAIVYKARYPGATTHDAETVTPVQES
jgi:uncharacterized protein (TIRG00374 family)